MQKHHRRRFPTSRPDHSFTAKLLCCAAHLEKAAWSRGHRGGAAGAGSSHCTWNLWGPTPKHLCLFPATAPFWLLLALGGACHQPMLLLWCRKLPDKLPFCSQAQWPIAAFASYTALPLSISHSEQQSLTSLPEHTSSTMREWWGEEIHLSWALLSLDTLLRCNSAALKARLERRFCKGKGKWL